jgi:hypothetical protein
LVSYEILRVYTLTGQLSISNSFKSVGRSLLIIGPAYAVLSTYFMYIPKEKYWDKLEFDKFKMEQMAELKPQAPMKKKIVEEIKSQQS